jgi:hypothetical protein
LTESATLDHQHSRCEEKRVAKGASGRAAVSVRVVPRAPFACMGRQHLRETHSESSLGWGPNGPFGVRPCLLTQTLRVLHQGCRLLGNRSISSLQVNTMSRDLGSRFRRWTRQNLSRTGRVRQRSTSGPGWVSTTQPPPVSACDPTQTKRGPSLEGPASRTRESRRPWADSILPWSHRMTGGSAYDEP